MKQKDGKLMGFIMKRKYVEQAL